MIQKSSKIIFINYLVATLGIFLLFFLILFYHSSPLTWDEPYFIENVRFFQKHGLSRKFLLEVKDQAPGPLYQIVHTTLFPLTKLQIPHVRFVNFACLILTIGMIYQIAKKYFPVRSPGIIALNIIAIPVIWTMSGLAMTEMPAMLFVTLSVLFFFATIDDLENPAHYSKNIVLASLSGLCLGMGILGRATYLVLLLSLPILPKGNFKNKKFLTLLLLTTFIAIILPLPIFWIWKGLLPPHQTDIGGGGLHFWHGMFGLNYFAITTAILCPKWFRINRWILLAILAGVLSLATFNYFTTHVYHFPQTIIGLEKAMGVAFGAPLIVIINRAIGFSIPAIYATGAIYFLYCSTLNVWEQRQNTLFLFCTASAFLIAGSCFKIAHMVHYRYIAQAAPFILLSFAFFEKTNFNKLLRISVGMSLGFLYLRHYLTIFSL